MSTYGVVSPTLLGVGAGRPSALTARLTVISSASGCAAEAARSISAARVWLRSSDRMDRMLDAVRDARCSCEQAFGYQSGAGRCTASDLGFCNQMWRPLPSKCGDLFGVR